ncbi:MAG: IS3 family transposase [Chitinophagales bacterium]
MLRGISARSVLYWSGIRASSFYYKKSGGHKGIKPSTHSVNSDGELFENTVVVKDIEKTLHQEFCCYGYRNMTGELKDLGWIINHKKVYRLMKEHKLLYGGRIRPEPFKRNFIRFRTPVATRPLQYLAMDIKYVHIHGSGRNALLLTVMDIYSRKVLVHLLRNSIKKGDVLVMLSLMLLEYKAEGMTLRNDNGSQFIANAVRQYLKDKGIYQEFSHVATPEDNAYIEALHSNLQREVIDRFEFDSIYHAQMIIDRYYEWYNEKRRHGSLNGKTPQTVWNYYFNPNPFEY